MLETLLGSIKRPKLLFFIILGSVAGYTIDFFGPEIKEPFKDRRARLEISSPSKEVELNKKIVVEATVHSIGRDELKPGAFSIQVDPKFISLSSDKAVALGPLAGSLPIKDVPDLKAIKLSQDHVRIVAKYESGKIIELSNELHIKIIRPVVIVYPHFDLTDIGRVNLSGEWTIELGGAPGKMTIRQGTDNNINGSFSVPHGTWTSGSVSGHKDGKTFRAQFSVTGKENTETIRVAGYFELSGPNGSQIELEGCAYHLRKSSLTYDERGAEGVKCEVDSVFYDYWEVVNAVRFYAKSPFERTE